mgnify:CR=1 FL=1|jgi:hypothetical protein|tara:strand:+ start:389 stop:553 length:165 start_codon:yes stop_codon:yes gene_type:complete
MIQKEVIEFHKKKLEKEENKIRKLDFKKQFIQCSIDAIKHTIWKMERENEKENI